MSYHHNVHYSELNTPLECLDQVNLIVNQIKK